MLLEGPSGEGQVDAAARAVRPGAPLPRRPLLGPRDRGRARHPGDARRPGSAAPAGMVFQDPEAQAVLGAVERDVAFGLESAGVAPARDPRAGARGARPRRRRPPARPGDRDALGRRAPAGGPGRGARGAAAGAAAGRAHLAARRRRGGGALATCCARLAAEEGTAVVLAEHRHERVRAVAGRALTVRGGPPGARRARAARAGARPAGPARRGAGAPSRASAPATRARPCCAAASLELRAGEVTALRGPQRQRQEHPAARAGRAAPAGRRAVVLRRGGDATAVPAERRFPAIGLVGQDPGRHLLTERVDDEVGFALRAAGRRPDRERRARVAETLEDLELGGLADRHPLDLSVGQRERVALAAILVARAGR